MLKINSCIMLCHCHHRDDRLSWALYEFDEELDELVALCDASTVEYAVRNFKSGKRQREWLAVRLALKELSGCEIAIAYKPDGKPYRVDGKGYVSISHSGNLVAVALHDECDIGIDVELRSSRISAVRGRVLSPAEEMALDSSNEEGALLLHWSAKESFYKIIGNRGGSFVDSFRVSPFKVAAEGSFGISYLQDAEILKTCTVNYMLTNDFVLTFCVDTYGNTH